LVGFFGYLKECEYLGLELGELGMEVLDRGPIFEQDVLLGVGEQAQQLFGCRAFALLGVVVVP
jgi:hypothetical protein